MTDDRELSKMEKRFRELEREQVAKLRVPKFAAKILTRRIGIRQSTLTNWLTRDVFDLDADRHRPTKKETRLYSARDALLLACASYFVASGTPLRTAKAFSERIIDDVGHLFRPKASIGGAGTLLVFPRGDEWIMAFQSGAGNLAAEVLGADGKYRSENISKTRLPPAYLAFDSERFIKGVLQDLGEGLVEVRAAEPLGKSR